MREMRIEEDQARVVGYHSQNRRHQRAGIPAEAAFQEMVLLVSTEKNQI